MNANEYACATQMEDCQYACENGYYYQNRDGDDAAAAQNNNNNNQNGDDQNQNQNEYCYYECLADAEMSYCDGNNNNNQNGQDMNLDELVECRALGGEGNQNNNNQNNYYGNNNNGNYKQYYVGAYCTSKGVFLGTFTDSSCTYHAPSGTYEKYMGYSLPTTNLVGTDCISCKGQNQDQNNNNNNNNQNNNNNNYNYQEEINESCERLYEDAGKCETNMDSSVVSYKNTQACDLMHGTLKRLDAAFHNSRRPAVGLAWFFGVSCAVLVGYVVWLHTKVLNRQQVNLISGGRLGGNSGVQA